MERKYEVYIGGKPLRFHDDEVRNDLPVIEVRDKSALRKVVGQLRKEGAHNGFQLRVPAGFDAWQAFRADHEFVAAAGGVVVDELGRLLAIKRLGKWDLPKGKVEKREAIEDAAVREVEEECGLEQVVLIKPVTSTWHTYERKQKHYLKRTDWFLMHASSKERLTPQFDEDIEEVRWLDERGIRMMESDTYPSLLPVLAAWRSMMA
ncbi:MAG TPA: NUDIX domain-containing protein [Flavobacteriales bacterium]|nr:NUDIX domain-containing protein [Flavobacteriales bacterium]